MIVTYFPNKLPGGKTTLVLGGFESFHKGHELLFNKAREFKNKIAVMLFEQPSLLPKNNKKEYASLNVRLQQLANYGIEKAIVVKFTDEIKNMNGQDFLKKLVDLTNATQLVCGNDFAMGFNRGYGAEDIAKDYQLSIVEMVKYNEQKISTSLLKELVESGGVDTIKKLSSFSYTIDSKLEKDFTFAINILPPHKGIYAAWAVIDEVKYWALVKIGYNDNFAEIPDFLFTKNAPLVTFEMRKMTRAFIKKEQDIIFPEDRKKVINYLVDNI